MRSTLRVVGTALALVWWAASARPVAAGIADSPIPNIGLGSALVYTVTGVQQNDAIIGTLFMCTSTDKTTITIAAEIFGPAGGPPLNDVTTGNGSHTVSPGQTFTFGTGGSGFPGIFTDQNIGGIGSVGNGSARIISTSKNILCTVMVADKTSNPPVSMTTLPVISKLKEKGV